MNDTGSDGHGAGDTPQVRRAARALAEAMGDDLDHTFRNKSEWIDARGEKGGRYRDVNEPTRADYHEGVRAVLQAIKYADGVDEDVLVHVSNTERVEAVSLSLAWDAMIDAYLGDPHPQARRT